MNDVNDVRCGGVVDGISFVGRSRRIARKSYVDMDLAESEDELAAAISPGRSRGKLARKQSRLQDDDEDDFVIEAGRVRMLSGGFLDYRGFFFFF